MGHADSGTIFSEDFRRTTMVASSRSGEASCTAARYLRIPAATLRAWTLGRALSFSNLIEAHVLRALRNEHRVPLKELRQALEFAERELVVYERAA